MRFLACLLCVLGATSLAVAQITVTLNYTFDASPPSTAEIDFTINIEVSGQTVSRVEIVNVTGSTSTAACTEVFDELPNGTSGGKDLILKIDATSVPPAFSTAGMEICYLEGDRATGVFNFTIRTRVVPENDHPNDMEFFIETGTPFSATNEVVTGTQVLQIFPATGTTYTSKLSFVDENGNPQIMMALGDAARLKYTMVVNSYANDQLSPEGAVVSSCSVGRDAAISVDRYDLIGSNGCILPNFLFRKLSSTDGFTNIKREAAGGVFTFESVTPSFEVTAYAQEHILNTQSEVHVQCMLTFCNDASQTGPGECGGNNCSPVPVRRRRDVSNSDVVTATLTILPRSENKTQAKECTCPNPSLLFGSMGGLGVLALTCFVIMIVTYIDAERSIRRRVSSTHTTSKHSDSSCPTAKSRTFSPRRPKSYIP